ncbi:MAG: cation diffusion facilitator family transporter [Oscillospiraceae bacterium]|nr:cation diffusion facilitator family transporter [Oscillospiraceae bacterium]
MTNFIIRLFIRDYKDTENPTVRTAYGKVAGLVGIVTNLLLTAAKMLVGILFNSIAITADAINNLTDSASSVVTMVGFKLASKPADEEHPYGHARIEYIAGLIVSIIILVLGVELGRSSLDKIISPEETGFNFVVLGVLIGSILVKLWQCLFYRKMGKSIHSTTLKATATDSLNDVVATSVVLIGTVISYFIGFNLDGYLGMAVAIFIIISGIQLVRETSSPLMGQAPSQALVEQLRKLFDGCDQIIGYHDLQLHDYGEQMYFATVHFEMDNTMTLEESHGIIDRLERQVKEQYNVELVAHLDPVTVGDARTNQLQSDILSFLHTISPLLSIHDFQVEWETPTVISFDLLAPYRFHLEDEALEDVVTKGVHHLCPGSTLRLVIDHGDHLPDGEKLEEEQDRS